MLPCTRTHGTEEQRNKNGEKLTGVLYEYGIFCSPFPLIVVCVGFIIDFLSELLYVLFNLLYFTASVDLH